MFQLCASVCAGVCVYVCVCVSACVWVRVRVSFSSDFSETVGCHRRRTWHGDYLRHDNASRVNYIDPGLYWRSHRYEKVTKIIKVWLFQEPFNTDHSSNALQICCQASATKSLYDHCQSDGLDFHSKPQVRLKLDKLYLQYLRQYSSSYFQTWHGGRVSKGARAIWPCSFRLPWPWYKVTGKGKNIALNVLGS